MSTLYIPEKKKNGRGHSRGRGGYDGGGRGGHGRGDAVGRGGYGGGGRGGRGRGDSVGRGVGRGQGFSWENNSSTFNNCNFTNNYY